MLAGTVDQIEMQKGQMKAIRLSEKDIAPAKVSRRLGVHRKPATRWRKEWLAGGEEAPKSRGKLGRRGELSEEQEVELAALLEAGTVAAGLPTKA